MLTVNLRYTGKGGSAMAFVRDMIETGTVAAIRAEPGNLRYEYYLCVEDPETVLLIGRLLPGDTVRGAKQESWACPDEQLSFTFV